MKKSLALITKVSFFKARVFGYNIEFSIWSNGTLDTNHLIYRHKLGCTELWISFDLYGPLGTLLHNNEH